MPQNMPVEGLKNAAGRPLLGGAKTIQAAPAWDLNPDEMSIGMIPFPMGGGPNLAGEFAKALQYEPEFVPWQGAKNIYGMGKAALGGLKNAFRGGGASMPELPIPKLPAPPPQMAPIANPIAEAAGGAMRQPKPGGVLHQVLERAGLKQGMGQANTPGEAGLLKQFGKGLGQPKAPPGPSAKYLGMQEGMTPNESFPLFNIEGGESHGSTVTMETLRKMGIPVPNY